MCLDIFFCYIKFKKKRKKKINRRKEEGGKEEKEEEDKEKEGKKMKLKMGMKGIASVTMKMIVQCAKASMHMPSYSVLSLKGIVEFCCRGRYTK